MRGRDLDTLEFPKLLDALATHTGSAAGAERCRALRPSADRVEVERRLATLEQYLRLTAEHPHAPRVDVPDLRPLLALAAHEGAVLEGRDLAAVLATMRLASALRRHLDHGAAAAGLLAALVARLGHPVEMEGALARAIDDSGNVRDDATPELAELRASLRTLRADVEGRLVQLLADAGSEVAPEQYATLRNDRFVVPIRTAAAGRIPGVIQDRSGSGETIFLEPLFAVECNNRLVLLRKGEEAEERRVCARLTDAIRSHHDRLASVFDAVLDCDVLAARAALARRLDGTLATVGAPGVDLVSARHPLLVLADRAAVPVDLHLPAGCHGLVVTGPNTGGKTVALKTMGLLALMAQSGLAIPAAEGSGLPCFAGIYADIGDSQSIERNLSTFSSHVENLSEIVRHADARSLVLLDEPGVGTDPTEGAALAVALLRYLRERGAFIAASSHAADVKTFALTDAGFEVAAVDVDPVTGEPRYQLRYQILGQSLALPMARRMGLPGPILDAASRQLAGAAGPDVARAAERLDAVRRAYEEKLAELERQHAALAAREAEQAALVADLETRRRRAWHDALAEARTFVRELRDSGRRALEELRRAGGGHQAFQKAVAEHDMAVAAAAAAHGGSAPAAPQSLRVGDEVEVADQGIRGELVELAGDRARILRGSLRFEVPARALRRVATETAGRSASPPQRVTTVRFVEAPVPEVDAELSLLGWRAREAIRELDAFLDRAMRAGHASVRIIHGVGTGALRQAVQEYLADCPYCTGYREGSAAEGGVGVTVVELAV